MVIGKDMVRRRERRKRTGLPQTSAGAAGGKGSHSDPRTTMHISRWTPVALHSLDLILLVPIRGSVNE